MNNGNDLPSSSQQHIYTVRGTYRYMATIIFGFILIECIILIITIPRAHRSASSVLLLLLFPLVLGILALVTARVWRNARIVTSDSGLVYYGRRYSIYTPWKNLAERSVWSTGRSSVEAVRLSEPAKDMRLEEGIQQQQAAIERKGRPSAPGSLDYATRFIPLGYFMKNWQDSQLGNDIKQHAPQVFDHLLPTRHTQAG